MTKKILAARAAAKKLPSRPPSAEPVLNSKDEANEFACHENDFLLRVMKTTREIEAQLQGHDNPNVPEYLIKRFYENQQRWLHIMKTDVSFAETAKAFPKSAKKLLHPNSNLSKQPTFKPAKKKKCKKQSSASKVQVFIIRKMLECLNFVDCSF